MAYRTRPTRTAPALAIVLGGLLAAPTTAQKRLADALTKELADPALSTTERLQRMTDRARALHAWHLPSAMEATREAQAEADRLGSAAYRALAMAIESRGLVQIEGASAASELLARAARIMPADAPARLRGHLAVVEVGLYYHIDEYGLAAEALEKALSLAEQYDDKAVYADCLLELHDLFYITDTGYDPTDDLRQAEALFTELGDARGLRRVRMRWVDVWTRQGLHEDAERELAALEQEGLEHGDLNTLGSVFDTRFSSALHNEELEEATRLALRELETIRAIESDERTAWAQDKVAWVYLLRGQPEQAAPYLEPALAIAERLGIRGLERAVLESAVELARHESDSEALLRHSQRLASLVEAGLGRATRDEAQARSVLNELHRERRALYEEARQRDEQRLHEQERSAARIAYYQRLAGGIALALTAAVAALLFRGKRRAERMHRQLLEQTERAKQHEQAKKRLEDQLVQLERLDSIGLLSAGIAHDFNNILCGISGHAELLEQTTQGQEREQVRNILQASLRAADLCTRLMDYARPSADKRDVVDLREVATDARALLDASTRGGPAPVLELESSPVPAEIDRTAIEQVVLNLVRNAQDESVGASRVVVRVRRTETIEDGEEGTWFGRPAPASAYGVLEVEDDGSGLSAAHLRRVFDPFFTTKFEGRGLGLSASYGIVTGHGGAFHVTTQKGLGTRFTAYLPASEATARASAGTPLPEPAAALPETSLLPRVLAVDDEPGILAFVQNALEAAGHEVHVASSGPEAERILSLRGGGIDVILLDLSMPDMDGNELLNSLRETNEGLPVVLMSGHDERFVRDCVRLDDVTHLLRKPFDSTELRHSLSNAARRA